MYSCSDMCLFVDICLLLLFFFFKQKTAYEMRISDWSSDVCSSDLGSRRSRSPKPWRGGGRRSRPSAPQCCPAAADRTYIPRREPLPEIGRASCRERVCQYV